MAKIGNGLMPEWKDLQVIDKVDVKIRVPPEGTWVAGGGIEIPYIYFFFFCMEQRFVKLMYEKKMKNIRKIKYFKKH